MNEQEILRYLELLDRRIVIALRSGIDWLPEYEQELRDIDAEIAVPQEKIDKEHKKRALT